MATRKNTTDTPPEGDDTTTSKTSTAATGDGGAAEVQAKMDEATEKGYFGTVPDPIPNERYSLQTGPDSPSASETRAALAAADTAAKEA